jgi:hypothetical protein
VKDRSIEEQIVSFLREVNDRELLRGEPPMMVSIYMVTYRNPIYLNKNIASILASGADVRINVINNHSEFVLDPRHRDAVTVLHNTVRPDFSTGHLARNWNQALLLGFQDLKNPACDIVITVQDDVIFKVDWFSRLLDLHRRYSFITMGIGDAFCSYLPEAVRKIGLWDERFTDYHAADYFLRALIYNREGSSINDPSLGRLHNAVESNKCGHDHVLDADTDDELDRADSMLITEPPMNLDRKKAKRSIVKFARVAQTVFSHKWKVSPVLWTEEHHALRSPLIPSYIIYPYFEKDVEGLREKNYIVSDDFLNHGH